MQWTIQKTIFFPDLVGSKLTVAIYLIVNNYLQNLYVEYE